MNPKPDNKCGRGGDIILLSEIITNFIYGKKHVIGSPLNFGLLQVDITMIRRKAYSMYRQFRKACNGGKYSFNWSVAEGNDKDGMGLLCRAV